MKLKSDVKTGALWLGVIFLILGAINSTLGNVSGGTVCFAAGILVILLFHFDVKKFNVFGLAAELREKLSEADKILETLRGISLPISEIAITTASQAGRYDSVVPRKKLYDFVMSISEELKSMGAPIESIEKIKESWYLATLIDMALPIHREIQHQIQIYREIANKKLKDIQDGRIELSQDDEKEFDEQYANIEYDNFNYYEEEAGHLNTNYKSYPEHFRNLISKLKGIPEKEKNNMLTRVSENILDMEYLINRKEIRRPDIWFK